MITVHILLLIVGLILITWASDKFIVGAIGLSELFGLSPLFMGLTVVAFGTATPEIFISITSAMHKKNALALGDILGSNIANIGLILGICALIKPLKVHSKILTREYPALFITLLLSWLLLYDHHISRFDGIILLLGFVALLSWMIWISIRTKKREVMAKEFAKELPKKVPLFTTVFYLILGGVLLPISSTIIVRNAINIATILKIDEMIIGLTIIAIGSSLPELATAVSATLKKEYDIVIGNIIGSNMFNILIVLPFPGLINPGYFQKIILQRDLVMMCLITMLLFLVLRGIRGNKVVHRWEGVLLLTSYFGYLAFLGFSTLR